MGVRKANVWLRTKVGEHSFTITSLWNQAAAALSSRHTINSPWGAAWSLCLTACSWTPCWAIYFTANIPSVYWSVAPWHTAALPPQDRKASRGLNKPCLLLQEQQLLFWRELELTAVSELSTYAPRATVEECWPRQMVLVPVPQLPLCPLTFCLPSRARETQLPWGAFTGLVV